MKRKKKERNDKKRKENQSDKEQIEGKKGKERKKKIYNCHRERKREKKQIKLKFFTKSDGMDDAKTLKTKK